MFSTLSSSVVSIVIRQDLFSAFVATCKIPKKRKKSTTKITKTKTGASENGDVALEAAALQS